MIFFAYVVILASLLYYYWNYAASTSRRKLPPGPTPLPIVGNIGVLARHPYRKTPYVMFQDLCRKYGPIISLRIGAQEQVVVEEYETIRELLNHEAWVDRYFDERTAQRSFGKELGVLLTSGDVWKEMRRFSIRTLRDFGFGKHSSMNDTIQEELAILMADLNSQLAASESEAKASVVVPMHQFFTISILNILWQMVAGFRFSHTDTRLKQLLALIDQSLKENSVGGVKRFLYGAFPFLSPLWNFISKNVEVRAKMTSTLNGFLREFLEERRAIGTYREDQRDFIDVFLTEIDAHANEKQGSLNHYTDDQFVVVVKDLFLAGSETTANTTEFAVLYMMLHPGVQRRVQAEMDQIVGPNRTPTMTDKPSLPYTEATLLEIQRMASVLPLIARAPCIDTTIGKYEIKKGTVGMINLYSMHKNPTTFPDPFTFNPERFYDAASNSVVNAHKIMPFGSGKRVCLGEVLAKTTLFTYFATLMQQYAFSIPSGAGDPNSPELRARMMEPVPGFTLSPKPFSICIKKRLL